MSAKTISVFLLALVLSGCAMQMANRVLNGGGTSVELSTPAATDTQSAFPSPSPVTPERFTAAPAPISTATVSFTATPQAVTVAAQKGNIFIRRGPDAAFNAISVLMKGQSGPALARDVLGTWVQIPLPGHPDETGWVSIQTAYSMVSGDVMSLPETAPTDWPVLASLRNCTYHQMVTDPGGIVIPSLDNFPANDVPVNPGIYRIHDTDVDGSPEVLKVELREGSAIDIRVNGDGEKRKCPQP